MAGLLVQQYESGGWLGWLFPCVGFACPSVMPPGTGAVFLFTCPNSRRDQKRELSKGLGIQVGALWLMGRVNLREIV